MQICTPKAYLSDRQKHGVYLGLHLRVQHY